MSKTPYNLIETKTAEEFIEILSPLKRDPSSRENMIYRGQSDSKWKLTPSLYRDTDIAINPLWDSHQVLNYELNILYFFVENIGNINLSDYRTAKLSKSILKISKKFQKIISKKSQKLKDTSTDPFIYRNWPDIEILELMALAQHSGLPTRLLDWTYSPYVAAYFAAFNFINSEIPAGGKICVWAINKKYTADFRERHRDIKKFPTSICRLEPPFWGSNPNAIAQSGCFLFIRGLIDNVPIKEVHIDDYIYSNYDSVNNPEKNYKSAFLKITVPAKESEAIIKLCNLFGVSWSKLFRSYEGCAEELKIFLPSLRTQNSDLKLPT